MPVIWRFSVLFLSVVAEAAVLKDDHHHHHHHHGHHRPHGHSDKHKPDPVAAPDHTTESSADDQQILNKLHSLEKEVTAAETAASSASKPAVPSQAATTPVPLIRGKLQVNAPLPVDFGERFADAVADATGCNADQVRVVGAVPVKSSLKGSIDEVQYEADANVVAAVAVQAADPSSKLSSGELRKFLVEQNGEADPNGAQDVFPSSFAVARGGLHGATEPHEEATAPESADAAPDTDVAMPYGGLEPFGREDTAKELTDSSIRESDAMVDQLERAEVAEEKRAVFRALTRLRGAAITSFDGVARAHTGNLDEYARKNQWRDQHPLAHLADEESDTSRWAFPEKSDF